jgi:branched-subunit amino acid transport protein AzlD
MINSLLLFFSDQDAAAGIVMLLVIIVIAIVGLAFYFLPFIIAVFRGHHNSAAIFVLNLLLGWSFIAWIVALVWAFTATDNRRR